MKENMGYLKKNWKGVRIRVKGGEGVLGSSMESHISHVLSGRMSSRPMGWSNKGAGKVLGLSIYWKNERCIEEVVRGKKRKR